MALAILFYVNLGLAILTVVVITTLFLVKNVKINKGIFVVLVLLTLLLSSLAVLALPSNYIMQKIIAGSWGVFALAAAGLEFFTGSYQKPAKVLLAASAIGALLTLLI